MKVILTTLNAKYIHSALALHLLRAFVRPDFVDTEIREYTIKDPVSRIVAELYACKPDVIAFSVYIWNVEIILAILSMLRKVLPAVTFILGGPEVSYDIEYWMGRAPEVDFIVRGEGEVTFRHLLRVLSCAGDVREVAGIAYRQEAEIRINPPRAELSVEDIPIPFQNEVELQALRNRVVYFESSRGCPFSCQFCLSSLESGVRYFPLERVKSELGRLIAAGVKTVKFVDRTFNLNRHYAMELFQFLIDQHGHTVFQFEISGDILAKEIVDFLNANAPKGLFRFEIGIQSTNGITNSLVQRKQNFDRIRETILAIKESDKIVQHLDLIAGLPEEDYRSFKKTFNDVFAFEPDELQLGFLKMLRGTGMRKRAKEFGYEFMDQAPYEVLYNNVLPYDDVLRIKQVEGVLDKYWNDGRLRHTVRYLTRHVFVSPFDFFQEFGCHWEGQGWDRAGHQLEDLFLRLDGFLAHACAVDERRIVRSFMMCDYLLQHRVRPHKVWWERRLNHADRMRAAKLIVGEAVFGEPFANLGLTEADIEKHVMLEVVPQLIDLNRSDRPLQAQPGLLLAYYPPGLSKGVPPTLLMAPLPDAMRKWCIMDTSQG